MAKLIGRKADMVVNIPWKFSVYCFSCLGEEVESDNREEGIINLKVEEKCKVVV